MRIAILGNGGFGTAMALTLEHAGHTVSVWGHDAVYTAAIAASRENPRYLPGVKLPDAIRVSNDAGMVLDRAGVVLVAVPTQHVRGVVSTMVDDHGWSLATFGRIVVFAGIYASVIAATRPTVEAVEGGWVASRRSIAFTVLVFVSFIGVALYVGGIE